MSVVWLSGLPDPPEGRTWCVACAMFCKGEINAASRDHWKAVNEDGKDDRKWYAPKTDYPLQAAVVRGYCAELRQLGILDLCWSHLAGVTIEKPSAVLPANGPLPKGLLRGRG